MLRKRLYAMDDFGFRRELTLRLLDAMDREWGWEGRFPSCPFPTNNNKSRVKNPLNVDQLGAELSWGAVVVKITYLAETSVLYENPREKAERQAWLLEQTGKNNPIPEIWVLC
jgi:hypothetical protein